MSAVSRGDVSVQEGGCSQHESGCSPEDFPLRSELVLFYFIFLIFWHPEPVQMVKRKKKKKGNDPDVLEAYLNRSRK